MKKYFEFILVLFVCADSLQASSSYQELKKVLSGVWAGELQNYKYEERRITFSAFYEFAPNIIMEHSYIKILYNNTLGQEYLTRSNDNVSKINPLSHYEIWDYGFKNGRGYQRCNTYIYDEELDAFYVGTAFLLKDLRFLVVFDVKDKKLYSFLQSAENIERLKTIRKYGKSISEMSEYAYTIITFQDKRANLLLNKAQSTLPFFTLFKEPYFLEKIVDNYDSNIIANLLAKRFTDKKRKKLWTDLCKLFGDWRLSFNEKHSFDAYINLGQTISMAYFLKEPSSKLSGTSKNLKAADSPGFANNYLSVSFKKFFVHKFSNGIPFIILESEKWFKQTQSSAFEGIENLYIGVEESNECFIFYTSDHKIEFDSELYIQDEDMNILGLKKNLIPAYKIKFGVDNVNIWQMKDGRWNEYAILTRDM